MLFRWTSKELELDNFHEFQRISSLSNWINSKSVENIQTFHFSPFPFTNIIIFPFGKSWTHELSLMERTIECLWTNYCQRPCQCIKRNVITSGNESCLLFVACPRIDVLSLFRHYFVSSLWCLPWCAWRLPDLSRTNAYVLTRGPMYCRVSRKNNSSHSHTRHKNGLEKLILPPRLKQWYSVKLASINRYRFFQLTFLDIQIKIPYQCHKVAMRERDIGFNLSQKSRKGFIIIFGYGDDWDCVYEVTRNEYFEIDLTYIRF